MYAFVQDDDDDGDDGDVHVYRMMHDDDDRVDEYMHLYRMLIMMVVMGICMYTG